MSSPDRTHMSGAGRPSAARQVLAIVALVSLAGVVLLLVATLLRTPVLLVGSLVGFAVACGGGWWAITEVRWRRWAGVAVLIAGLALIVLSVLRGLLDEDRTDGRLVISIVLLAVAIVTARAAMVRDLHAGDAPEPQAWRPRHAVLICNPKSGGGKVETFGLVALAEELGVEVVLLEPGTDLAQLARDAIARGADCLGMAGGDGSQALVASIAIEHQVPFVVISAGTRNHFALDLGLNRDDPRTGMVAFRDGVLRDVDYATVGDRLFVNNVSLGIYASIVEEEGYRDAKIETSLAKLPEMLGRQTEPFDLQFEDPDGGTIDGAFLVLISNNPYVLGPSLDVSQRRALDTGRLGVFAVTAATGAEAARMVTRATLGRGGRDPNLHQFTSTDLVVRSRSGQAWTGIDGESLRLPTPLHFAIHPKGLRLLVPPASLVTAEKRRARDVSARALVDIALGHAPRAAG